MTIKVAVLGAKGRMGSQTCQAVETASDCQLNASVPRRQRPSGGEQRLGVAQCAGENERALQRADQGEGHIAGL